MYMSKKMYYWEMLLHRQLLEMHGLCKIKCDNMEEVKDDVSVLGDDIYDGVF